MEQITYRADDYQNCENYNQDFRDVTNNKRHDQRQNWIKERKRRTHHELVERVFSLW